MGIAHISQQLSFTRTDPMSSPNQPAPFTSLGLILPFLSVKPDTDFMRVLVAAERHAANPRPLIAAPAAVGFSRRLDRR